LKSKYLIAIDLSILPRYMKKPILIPGQWFTLVVNPKQLLCFNSVGRDRFVRDDELKSDDMLPLVSRSNPVPAAFAFDLQI
jgi:hypothetical protein